jgi:hypothetical protein
VRPLLDIVHRTADAVGSAVGGTGFGKGGSEKERKNGDLAGSAPISFFPVKRSGRRLWR